MYKHEGIKGFYRGIFAMFIRDFPSYGLYLLSYELLHTYISSQSYSDKNGIIAALVAGGAAGCISWVSIMPADVIKSRIQVDHIGRYKGFWDCAYLTVKRGGFMMLYRGTFITILRAFPVNAVTFLVYTEVVKILNFLNPPLSMQSVQTIQESNLQD